MNNLTLWLFCGLSSGMVMVAALPVMLQSHVTALVAVNANT